MRMFAACVTAFAAVSALGLAWGLGLAGAQAQAPTPTFNREVAPILFASCAMCHRPGDIAPMSLLSYDAARPWARAIKAKVLSREMPPWSADTRFGQFRNEHRLLDSQIATLVAWADAGAPEGEGTPPLPPKFVEGWTSRMDRPPDQVIEAPLDLELPARGIIPEFTVWAKVPFGKDRFIEAIELRPTNRKVVHHASVFRGKLPRGANVGRAEAWPGGPLLDGIPMLPGGAPPLKSSMLSGQPLVFYVPAGGFLRFPSGVAKKIESDEYLMWTFHLMPSGEEARAGARIGLWFSQRDVRDEVITWTITDRVLVNGKEVGRDSGGPMYPNIPPNDSSYTVTGLMKVARPLTLYALWPHMHNRGRDITFSVMDSRGREQILLSVPRYRFAWQFVYELATPLRIPAGSTLKAIAHYDNSSMNPENPDPNQEVTWGPQSTNEMFDPFVEIAYERRQPSLLDLSQ